MLILVLRKAGKKHDFLLYSLNSFVHSSNNKIMATVIIRIFIYNAKEKKKCIVPRRLMTLDKQ